MVCASGRPRKPRGAKLTSVLVQNGQWCSEKRPTCIFLVGLNFASHHLPPTTHTNTHISGYLFDSFCRYQKAAEEGSIIAQRNLGYMFQLGKGVQQCDKTAVKWFREAAKQGDAEAQTCLGKLIEIGKGTEQNNEEALKWLQKAAAQGSSRGSAYASELGAKMAFENIAL